MYELPKDGRSQEIGRLAGRALGIKLPKAWIEKELDGDSDFGLDYFMQLKSQGNEVAFSFYLQLKGTTVPSYSSDKTFVSFDFKVATLNYYHQQEPLVMVAIVDLTGDEDKLWECPIYYVWLDDEWFSKNKEKLETNKTISIRIPTIQSLDPSLDIYDFYAKRLDEKLAVSELKKEINSHSGDVVKSIGSLTEAISEKPIFLKTAENCGDEPWIENPKGEVPTLLKSCSDSLNTNQIGKAKEILDKLEIISSDFSPHELAEFFYQQAMYLSVLGLYSEANKSYQSSTDHSQKDRYKLGFIESKFKLDVLPNDNELVLLSEELPIHDYRNTIVKAKCLALLGKTEDALGILKTHFPEKVVGQLVILTIAKNEEGIDSVITEIENKPLDNDRENYTFHSFAARRSYIKANSAGVTYEKVLPIQGQVSLNIDCMKTALIHIEKAWQYARKIGYPADITILFDMSSLIFSYFNKLDELFYHYDEILQERPNNSDLIQYYSRLLFNNGQYEKTLNLIERIKPDLNGDDCGLLIISNYHLNRTRIALELVKTYEAKILGDKPENISLIFCLSAEMANDLLEEKLADRYVKIVEGFDDGKAILAISSFVKNANETPKDRDNHINKLHEEYLQLNKPTSIAEQLCGVLNPTKKGESILLIELANDILSAHEIFEKDYFRLAQAYITNGDYSSAISLAEKHIDKGIFDPYWQIIQTVCLENLGKPGLAHDVIKKAIEDNQFSNEYLKHYVHICLQLGLLENVETALIDLFNSECQREEKLSYLSNLISIYSSNEGKETKLSNAIRRFGKLVKQDDCIEEGQFLMFSLTSPKNDDADEVKEFQARLSRYIKNFPDSPILKQGNIEMNNGPEAMIDSLNKMTGITEEQIEKWEQNKLKIRSGSLPVPFFMLERFLSDTRDIFTSWVLSINASDEHLEFMINQAPQLNQNQFSEIFCENTPVVIEDTTLLILNELDLLDAFLEATTEFYLLDSTFERLTKNQHPLAGSIHCYIPQKILDTINKHKTKFVLFSSGDLTPLEAYKEVLSEHKAILLIDDVHLLRLISLKKESSVTSGNSFNIIEYLSEEESISIDEKYKLVTQLCSLGIYQPNMNLKLLTDTMSHFINVVDGIDYAKTEFEVVFDKIFSASRDSAEAIDLFFRTISFAIENSNLQLQSKTLIALFKGLLNKHSYKELGDFTAFLFVYLCMVTRINIESPGLSTSSKHVALWEVYRKGIGNDT